MTRSPFTDLVLVAALALAAPLLAATVRRVRIPAPVIELALGAVAGKAVLGVLDVDGAVSVFATAGLAFLLLLAGLEVQVETLRGPLGRLAVRGAGLTIVLALGVGHALAAVTGRGDGWMLGTLLVATALGLVVPVLKDAGVAQDGIGQIVIASASIADVAAIALLSALFATGDGLPRRLAPLGAFIVVAAVVALVLIAAGRVGPIAGVLLRLQDTTAQIRVRGTFLLLVALVALAQELGLEVLLGAFAAGLVLAIVDRDEPMSHPLLRTKLEAAGFGIFVPVFFVSSGARLDLRALASDRAAIALIPLVAIALLVAHALPAILYRHVLPGRAVIAAGLLQSTSLPFLVAATTLATETGRLSPATAAGIVGGGLATVLLYPAIALRTLPGGEGSDYARLKSRNAARSSAAATVGTSASVNRPTTSIVRRI